MTLGLALKRGFLGRCPNCGEGRLFRAFVKVADHCETCGEAFRYHRADDFPAYLVRGCPVRLLVQPDLELPYYDDSWQTDGAEGEFGRRQRVRRFTDH